VIVVDERSAKGIWAVCSGSGLQELEYWPEPVSEAQRDHARWIFSGRLDVRM
jgi:hypothetical protein